MKKFVSAFIVLSATGIVILFSCKKTVQNVLTFNAPEVETAIVIQVYQAGTSDLIGMNGSGTINLSIEGEDKGLVRDIFGRAITSLTTSKGIYAFAIANTVAPSLSDPVELVFVFTASGYQEASMPVRLVSTGDHSFIVHLLKLDNPPNGVVISEGQVGSTDANGVLQNSIETETTPAPLTNALTRITVPAGTVLKDASGNPLTGDITSRIIYYSNQSPDAVACFTGGFCVKIKNEVGVIDNTLFFTGGWADYDLMDEQGRFVSCFSNPVNIYFEVPVNTFNPETKTLVKAGDYFPMWNYNLNDGLWEFENEGLVQGPSGSGNWFIEYESTHFSKKNADKTNYDEIQWIKDLKGHRDEVQLRNSGQGQKNGDSFSEDGFTTSEIIRLVFIEKSTGAVYWSSGYLKSSGDNVYIPDAPCNLETKVQVWGGCPYAMLGETIVNDLCTQDPISIPLNNPTGSGELVDVTVSVFANCELSRIRPNISAFYEDGCGWKYVGQVVNGEITIHGLETGKGYSFGAWIDDYWFDEFFTINETSYTWNIDLPAEICSMYE